jgi:hypothetical protein
MLHARNPGEAGSAGYVGALRAATPEAGYPTVALVTREHAASLTAYNLDPQVVERHLTVGAVAGDFPRLEEQAAEILAQWFENPAERTRRAQIIAGVARGGAQ